MEQKDANEVENASKPMQQRLRKNPRQVLERVSTDDQKRVHSRQMCLQREYILMNFDCPKREVSKQAVNEVSKQSEQSIAERCKVSERHKWCKRMNIASDRVARSKRGCL